MAVQQVALSVYEIDRLGVPFQTINFPSAGIIVQTYSGPDVRLYSLVIPFNLRNYGCVQTPAGILATTNA